MASRSEAIWLLLLLSIAGRDYVVLVREEIIEYMGT